MLPRVLEFRPQIIFYQSGVDGLAEDRLGKLSLSLSRLRERERQVMKLADANAVPLVITLGGGYAEPIRLTAEAHASTFRVAREAFCRNDETGASSISLGTMSSSSASSHRNLWN